MRFHMKSWFARHMAPPPPLNASPTCPCAKCFNVIAQRRQTGAGAGPGCPGCYGGGASARRDWDGVSVVSGYGYGSDDNTATRHVEMARRQ
ncbi:hypothetical protein E4U41_006033 [Claviceps citrina]|nr:hypothetical protein E4U41_006033 [Claviceps citrina]